MLSLPVLAIVFIVYYCIYHLLFCPVPLFQRGITSASCQKDRRNRVTFLAVLAILFLVSCSDLLFKRDGTPPVQVVESTMGAENPKATANSHAAGASFSHLRKSGSFFYLNTFTPLSPSIPPSYPHPLSSRSLLTPHPSTPVHSQSSCLASLPSIFPRGKGV